MRSAPAPILRCVVSIAMFGIAIASALADVPPEPFRIVEPGTREYLYAGLGVGAAVAGAILLLVLLRKPKR